LSFFSAGCLGAGPPTITTQKASHCRPPSISARTATNQLHSFINSFICWFDWTVPLGRQALLLFSLLNQTIHSQRMVWWKRERRVSGGINLISFINSFNQINLLL
jgi:hypothetical protein